MDEQALVLGGGDVGGGGELVWQCGFFIKADQMYLIYSACIKYIDLIPRV